MAQQMDDLRARLDTLLESTPGASLLTSPDDDGDAALMRLIEKARGIESSSGEAPIAPLGAPVADKAGKGTRKGPSPSKKRPTSATATGTKPASAKKVRS